ncbi:class I SAM-dependent methyltransferase [Nocardioides massiliensis]|uniref:SAM-dependent methyltransferase n=1 Tax=Nocardioides massiliensis TaxID=1325935 RepID=A0ABT9NIW4_9ACTN|nr:methyltransferase domain-containing protein [Nocardioides massiliensis]MDP9820356.1 SAM-dependent methyltransferase [Nocardioides massiliensis]
MTTTELAPIERTWRRIFPEMAAGGFGRWESTVQFYGRVNALLRPDSVVVDFGAGRGEFLDRPDSYPRRLQLLRGKVAAVIGVDVDPVVVDNEALDRAIVWRPGTPIDLPDASVDLVVSDYAFEHIDDPAAVVGELDRILKPGGWVCARTPNRWGFIAIGARMVPNALHSRLLRTLQPQRKTRDVFPTRYRLNSLRQLRSAFPAPRWEVHGYAVGEPAYVGSSRALTYVLFGVLRVLPMRLQPMYLFFVQKAPSREL